MVPQILSRHRLPILTGIACLLIGLSRLWHPHSTWLWVIVAGCLLIRLMAKRAADDPFLLKLVTASFLVRVAIAVVLFAVSTWQLPILRSVQMGDGFWTFGGDGLGYHLQASSILDGWTRGVEIPLTGYARFQWSTDFALFVAVVYRVLGPSALHFMLVNAWLGTLTVVVAFLMARSLAGTPAARLSAALVAFWPSSLLWSTQILKDTSAVLMAMAAIFLVMRVWQMASHDAVPWSAGRLIRCCIGLAMVVTALGLVRFYMNYVLFASVSVGMGIAFVRAMLAHKWTWAAAAVGIIGIVGGATVVSGALDLERMALPMRVAEPDGRATIGQIAAAPRESSTPPAVADNKLDKQVQQGGWLLGRVAHPTQIPVALAIAVLAPLPWQWVNRGGQTGIFRAVAGIESLVLYFLLPAVAIAWWRLLNWRREEGWVLLAFILFTAVGVGMALAQKSISLGTFFRFRQQFLLPLLVVVGAAGLPAPYVRVFDVLERKMRWNSPDRQRCSQRPSRISSDR